MIIIWLIVSVLLLVVALSLMVGLVWMAVASIKGAPFVPMSRVQVQRMVTLAQIKKGDLAIDLGSGDGRLVIALAEQGAKAEGYEIQPFLVWWSQWQLYRKGLAGRARVKRRNLWQVDCKGAQVVTLYAFPSMMAGLEQKLQRELAPGARVVSLGFVFPNWQPKLTEGKIRVYER